jgi:hypothetical protein
MRIFSTLIFLIISQISLAQDTKISTIVTNPQIPKVTQGSIKHYENFESKYFAAHNIDVWLPENYNTKKNMPFCICTMVKVCLIPALLGTNKSGVWMK